MSKYCLRSYDPLIGLTIAALVLAGMAGCGSGLPKTYPVKGKVVFKGGKPVTDGKIQFQSTADPQLQAVGNIEPDGNFTLTTHKTSRSAKGAVAGTHKVIVELEGPAEVVTIPTEYVIEPRENTFTIELPKSRR